MVVDGGKPRCIFIMRSRCNLHFSVFLSFCVLLSSLTAGRLLYSSAINCVPPSFILKGKERGNLSAFQHRHVTEQVFHIIFQKAFKSSKYHSKKHKTHLFLNRNGALRRPGEAGTCVYTSTLGCIGTSSPPPQAAGIARGRTGFISSIFGTSSSLSPSKSLRFPTFLGKFPFLASNTPAMAPEECAETPPKVVFIIGPTGVGKSRLGLDICLELRKNGINAEIVSADSMQVCRCL